uniref:Uncharacterized protein n=1 Tax=Ditylenchus dipsaci TaxID=166011 RepID=A0A915CLW4_9BILA
MVMSYTAFFDNHLQAILWIEHTQFDLAKSSLKSSLKSSSSGIPQAGCRQLHDHACFALPTNRFLAALPT